VFNILGPMTNPAGAQAQLLGVFDEELTLKMAEVLSLLGCRHALVVHGEDGLDEVTLGGKTTVCELKAGEISRYQVDPNDFGFPRTELTKLRGGPPQENADILRRVLKKEKGPYRDIVVIKAAAALVAGDVANDLGKGTHLAADAIDSGRALDKLEKLISLSRRL
jgi:anthranilate phosphoribosyltransferase